MTRERRSCFIEILLPPGEGARSADEGPATLSVAKGSRGTPWHVRRGSLDSLTLARDDTNDLALDHLRVRSEAVIALIDGDELRSGGEAARFPSLPRLLHEIERHGVVVRPHDHDDAHRRRLVIDAHVEHLLEKRAMDRRVRAAGVI